MPLDSTASESKPFIKLGDPSTAPTLNYNLPQEACYSVEGYAVIPIPPAYYAPPTKEVPVKNPWSDIAALTPDKIIDRIRGELITGESKLLLGAEVVKNSSAAIKISPKVEVRAVASDGTPIIAQPQAPAPEAFQAALVAAPTDTRAVAATVVDVTRPPLASAGQSDVLIAGVPLDYVAEQAAQGKIPRIYKRFSGALAMQFLERPPAPKPTLTLVEHYRMCSYLGNYGAGKVVQTFSLLPGERTQITIKSYKNQNSSESTTASSSATTSTDTTSSSQANTSNSSIKNSSENLLDSYSEAAANEFEDIVNEEHGIQSLDSASSGYYIGSNTSSTTVPTTKSSGGGLKINLGIISFGGGSSTTGGGTTPRTIHRLA